MNALHDQPAGAVPKPPDCALMLAELRTALPGLSLLDRVEEVRPYECDGLPAYRQLPQAVALPRTEAELKAVLEICRKHRVPVVAVSYTHLDVYKRQVS